MPPILLAGKGAADYAFESGCATIHGDGLVSPGAKEKWSQWSKELRDAGDIINSKAFLRRPVKNQFMHFKFLPRFLPSTTSDTSPESTPGFPSNADTRGQEQSDDRPSSPSSRSFLDESSELLDNITDTVGAIAVDLHGNIAAGSSSGGVAMKHSGRIGPAALAGMGTAVIPVKADDQDGTCVATVTSGMGEHISTTLAASTCASRIYHAGGNFEGPAESSESITEDEAMKAMIELDFLSIP